MARQKLLLLATAAAMLVAGWLSLREQGADEERFVRYEVDLLKHNLQLYWRDEKGQVFGRLQNLKTGLAKRGQQLVFAMNGGMYAAGNRPKGLFVEDHKLLAPLDTAAGSGNFYLKPNGVFYTTARREAVICRTEDFVYTPAVQYATQSGPMLVLEGRIHPAFKPGSTNLNIRNGVGILPDGRVVFVLSRREVNLYDFAAYFRQLGCRNALYLDGLVSRMYLPEKNWVQTDGDFGVIIGVTARKTAR